MNKSTSKKSAPTAQERKTFKSSSTRSADTSTKRGRTSVKARSIKRIGSDEEE